MNVTRNFISVDTANYINSKLRTKCTPTENRVLILSPKGEGKVGSIIVPSTSEKELPRKGVVVMMGEITDEYLSYKKILQVGSLITYGMYAGKEIKFDPNYFDEEFVQSNKDTLDGFSVLSLNEIILVETNS